MSRFIRRQRFVCNMPQQAVIQRVQRMLGAGMRPGAFMNGDGQVLFRPDNAVLSLSAVKAEYSGKRLKVTSVDFPSRISRKAISG